MAILEYEPGAAFPGVIRRTAEESAPAWPAPGPAHEPISSVLRDEGGRLPARQ